MTEPLEDLVAERLDRARIALEDARVLAQGARWDGCVNRLYYACFYAVSALLHQKGHSSSKHTGIRSLFNVELVKSGKISKEQGRFFNRIFEHRQKADYSDFIRFEEEQVRPWMAQAEAFVAEITAVCTAKTPPEA